jgi:hypothetical protein
MITQRQQTALIHLIRLVGKLRYRRIKQAVGIDINTTLTRLTKSEASALIDALSSGVGR